MLADLQLRAVRDADLPIFFDQQLDPEANDQAAFTAQDPADRAAFDAHWVRIRANPAIAVRTIVAAGQVAGYIAAFDRDGLPEVSYWLGRAFWGRGLATAALKQFVAGRPAGPLYARAAHDHAASRRVLEKCGFVLDRVSRFYAPARGVEIEEALYRLEEEANHA